MLLLIYHTKSYMSNNKSINKIIDIINIYLQKFKIVIVYAVMTHGFPEPVKFFWYLSFAKKNSCKN